MQCVQFKRKVAIALSQFLWYILRDEIKLGIHCCRCYIIEQLYLLIVNFPLVELVQDKLIVVKLMKSRWVIEKLLARHWPFALINNCCLSQEPSPISVNLIRCNRTTIFRCCIKNESKSDDNKRKQNENWTVLFHFSVHEMELDGKFKRMLNHFQYLLSNSGAIYKVSCCCVIASGSDNVLTVCVRDEWGEW